MNKNLYGKKFPIDEKLKKHLEKCFNKARGASERTEGYKRNKDLRSMNDISYSQLKRIKNWFDKYQGDKNTHEYILNGEEYMKNWVNNVLSSGRNSVDYYNDNQENTGMVNRQELKPDISNLNRPNTQHRKTVEKYDTAVTESLRRINEIMKKII